MKKLIFTFMTIMLSMIVSVDGYSAPSDQMPAIRNGELQDTTARPVITFNRITDLGNSGVEIIVTGEGILTITLSVSHNGSLVDIYSQPYVTESPFSIFIPDDFNSITIIDVTAVAQKDGCLPSETVTSQYIMEGYRMAPVPEVYQEVFSHEVVVHAVAHGGFTVTVIVDDMYYHTAQDEVILAFPREDEDRNIMLMAYSEAPGFIRSNPGGGEITIPGRGLPYDFESGGIYYRIIGYNEVAVSYHPEGSYYAGDLVIPETVTWDGTTYDVTQIYFMACMFCTELNSVTIPSTVTHIGEDAFFGCYNLKQIKLASITPPTTNNSFDGSLYNQTTLFVPQEALEAYRAHEEWGQFLRTVPFIGAGPGDINGDGSIAINDVSVFIDNLLGSDELPACFDVNGDGDVSIADVSALIDLLLQ